MSWCTPPRPPFSRPSQGRGWRHYYFERPFVRICSCLHMLSSGTLMGAGSPVSLLTPPGWGGGMLLHGWGHGLGFTWGSVGAARAWPIHKFLVARTLEPAGCADTGAARASSRGRSSLEGVGGPNGNGRGFVASHRGFRGGGPWTQQSSALARAHKRAAAGGSAELARAGEGGAKAPLHTVLSGRWRPAAEPRKPCPYGRGERRKKRLKTCSQPHACQAAEQQ